MPFRRSALAVVFWRAVRLSMPLALAACDSRVTPVTAFERDCTSYANCGGGTVTLEVKTDLPHGAMPERFECDVACRPALCPSLRKACTINREPDAGPTVTCFALGGDATPHCPVPGRPVPEWHHEPEACSTARELFAQMSRAEAESVAEFERLALELELHGAPERLISRARAAAEEERRHARVTAQLAGCEAPSIPSPPKTLRSLGKLAEANLLEGCINETMSAVLVATQAEHASSKSVRHELASIAREELSHAEFSWELHAWLVSRLTPEARRALHDPGSDRIAHTLRNAVQALPDSARREAGLPDEALARAKAQVLAEELWLPALTALC